MTREVFISRGSFYFSALRMGQSEVRAPYQLVLDQQEFSRSPSRFLLTAIIFDVYR
jgi:hypothetical protein